MSERRVKIVADNVPGIKPGATGTVKNITKDGGRWVQMDKDITDEMANFPVGHPKRNHVLLWENEIEEIEFKDRCEFVGCHNHKSGKCRYPGDVCKYEHPEKGVQ